jgi:hypothetical protein
MLASRDQRENKSLAVFEMELLFVKEKKEMKRTRKQNGNMQISFPSHHIVLSLS